MDQKITLPVEAIESMRVDRDNLIRLIALTQSLVGAAENLCADFHEELPHVPEPNQTLSAERIHVLEEIARHTKDFTYSITNVGHEK